MPKETKPPQIKHPLPSLAPPLPAKLRLPLLGWEEGVRLQGSQIQEPNLQCLGERPQSQTWMPPCCHLCSVLALAIVLFVF